MELATWLRRGCVGQPKRDTDNGLIIGGQMKQTSDVTSQVCVCRNETRQ